VEAVSTEDEVKTTVVVQVNASTAMQGTVTPEQFAAAVAKTAGAGAEVVVSAYAQTAAGALTVGTAALDDAARASICAGLAEQSGIDPADCSISGVAAAGRRRRLQGATVSYQLTADSDISGSLEDSDAVAAAVSASAGDAVGEITAETPTYETEVDYTIVQSVDDNGGGAAAAMDSLSASLSDPELLSASIAESGGSVSGVAIAELEISATVVTTIIDNPPPPPPPPPVAVITTVSVVGFLLFAAAGYFVRKWWLKRQEEKVMEIKLGGVVAGSSVADGGSGWGSRSGALKRPSGQAWGNVGAPEAPPRKTSELGAAVPTSPGSVGGASNASSLLPQPPGAPRLGPDPDVMKNIMRRFGGPGGTASDLGISSGSNLAKQLRDRQAARMAIPARPPAMPPRPGSKQPGARPESLGRSVTAAGPAADAVTVVELEQSIQKGVAVLVDGEHKGVVRYTGLAHFGPGQWIGVAMDEAVGKHDGSVKGMRYFKCRNNHGIFVKDNSGRVEPLSSEEQAQRAAGAEAGTPERSDSGGGGGGGGGEAEVTDATAGSQEEEPPNSQEKKTGGGGSFRGKKSGWGKRGAVEDSDAIEDETV